MNGDLDVRGQETLLRHLKDTGIGGVFIAGTTGEFTALDDDERAVVLSVALELYGADAVYTHVGAAAARQAESLTAQAVALGARNLAAITPFYLPAGPAALLDYYRRLDAVADNARSMSTCTPRRTGSTVTPTNWPNWPRFRRSPGRRSAVNRIPKSCNMSGSPDDFEVYSWQRHRVRRLRPRRRNRCRVRGLQRVPATIPRPSRCAATAATTKPPASAQERFKQAVDAVSGADIALIKAGLSMQGLPAGPTRVALDQPTPAQLEALRTAVQDLT
jgi:4-hydroxy-tetrahydrodipicolinate synthase